MPVAGRKCSAMRPYVERNRCACPGDLNPCIRRSRWRVGWWEFSARCSGYRCWRSCGKKIGNWSIHRPLHLVHRLFSSEDIAFSQKMNLRKPLKEAHQHRRSSVSLSRCPIRDQYHHRLTPRKRRKRGKDFKPTRKQPPSRRRFARFQPADHIEGKAAHTQKPGPEIYCIRLRPKQVALLLLWALSDRDDRQIEQPNSDIEHVKEQKAQKRRSHAPP